MSDTSNTATIEVAFPTHDTGSAELATNLPALPTAPVSTGLETVAATPKTRQELSCSALLVGDTRLRAEAEANQLLEEMLANTAVAASYGQGALEGVNRLVDKLLHEKPPVDIPEVKKLMKQLSRDMRGLGSKYDPSDPEVIEKYEQVKGKLRRLLRIGKTFFEEFMDDIRDIEGKFDKAIEVLLGKEQQLIRNVAFYDEFYELNEDEVTELIYAIGVMELIRNLAAERAEAITVGDASLGDRGGEQQARLADFVTFMETKITAYKGRLWVAWAMAPQIRSLRSLSVLMAERLNETVHVGIPTMKSTIVVWQTMSEAEQAAELNRAVEEIINESLVQFAKAAAVTVPRIAQETQRPSLSPTTVKAMADSIAQQADGIVQAIEDGERQRTELDQAMLDGVKVLADSTVKVSDAQIQHVIDVAQQARQLEIATSVPAA